MSLAEDLPRSYIGSLSRHAPQKLARVSLADLASRTVPESSAAAARRATTAAPAVSLDLTERPEPAVVPLERKSPPPVEHDQSLDLLDRASKGMATMLGRYRQLEAHVKQVDAWANAQIQAAESETVRWQEAAAKAEKRLEDSQRTLDATVRRAEAAEQCMKRDKEALTVLQDRIVEAFGFGSDAHEAINTGISLG